MTNKEKEQKPIDIAKSVFQDIVHYAENNNTLIPSNVVIVGGVALSYFGIRESTQDIDVYANEVSSLYNISNRMMDYWKEKFGNEFDVDFTNNDTMWTDRIKIGNLNQCEKVCFINDSNGEPSLCLSVLSPEIIFILKSIADRDKDRQDLNKIFNYTSKEKIIGAINDIVPFNKSYDNRMMIESAMSNIQELSLELVSSEDLLSLKGLDEKCLLDIADFFGIEDDVLNLLDSKISPKQMLNH